MKIQNILNAKGGAVYTVRSGQPLREVLTLLNDKNIGAAVVVDESGKPVGIISERDFIRAAAQGEDIYARPVSHLMTKAITYGTPQDDLPSVMRTMTDRRFRHLPIMEQGQLVGIISIGDLIKARLDEFQGEIETLQTQITGG